MRVRKWAEGNDEAMNVTVDGMVELLRKLNYGLPRLVISVTGGAKDFELSKELQTVLRRGLRKVSTRAVLLFSIWFHFLFVCYFSQFFRVFEQHPPTPPTPPTHPPTIFFIFF